MFGYAPSIFNPVQPDKEYAFMTEGPERIRVLHVEDEPGFADITATLLEKEDERLDIRKANDPDEGLSLLADQPIDCIVSDYDMPFCSGIS